MPRSQSGAAAGEPLTARQVALLTRWIEQGATWQKHWSFIPPTRPDAAEGAEGCEVGAQSDRRVRAAAAGAGRAEAVAGSGPGDAAAAGHRSI